MHQQLHPKYTHSFIDSCAFNPIDKDESLCRRRLLEKSDELGLLLQITHSVQKEIDQSIVDFMERERIKKGKNLLIGIQGWPSTLVLLLASF